MPAATQTDPNIALNNAIRRLFDAANGSEDPRLRRELRAIAAVLNRDVRPALREPEADDFPPPITEPQARDQFRRACQGLPMFDPS